MSARMEMEMYDSLERVTLGIKRMRTEGDLMRATLLAAANQFSQYAIHHLDKEPPDREKAETNEMWSARCRRAAGYVEEEGYRDE